MLAILFREFYRVMIKKFIPVGEIHSWGFRSKEALHGRKILKRVDICITDSLCCTPETHFAIHLKLTQYCKPTITNLFFLFLSIISMASFQTVDRLTIMGLETDADNMLIHKDTSGERNGNPL